MRKAALLWKVVAWYRVTTSVSRREPPFLRDLGIGPTPEKLYPSTTRALMLPRKHSFQETDGLKVAPGRN